MIDIQLTNYIMLLIGIMILSGAFGGMTSAFFRKGGDQPFIMVIFKHIFVGIATAMVVPLMLNVFSSDLLENGRANPLQLFTLSGLCIFFALFSTRFLENVFKNKWKEEIPHPPQVQQTENKIEKRQEFKSTGVPAEGPEKSKLSENQLKILRALVEAAGAKLSLADLLKASAVPQNEFDEILAILMVKGFVAQELIEGNRLQLVLTSRGEQLLKKMYGK